MMIMMTMMIMLMMQLSCRFEWQGPTAKSQVFSAMRHIAFAAARKGTLEVASLELKTSSELLPNWAILFHVGNIALHPFSCRKHV